MAVRFDAADRGFGQAFSAFVDRRRAAEEDVDRVVADILDDVRHRGDEAVIDYTARFDSLTFDSADDMRVDPGEIAAARDACDGATVEALQFAADRIQDFHRRQLPEPLDYADVAGVRLGARWTAVDSAGIYAPGGKAAYPSSVLMNAVPAQVAGVERIVMTVPAPNGDLNPLVLAAADIAGVDEVYRIGGAQAVGALAYGTKTIAAVDKITGPGNAYVAAAKRRVFGIVGIDMIAGPSEILVVADAENDPEWIAADLLSQAEHDEDAQAILITDSAKFADDVVAAVESCLADLPRESIARASWNANGAVIVVPGLDDAIPLVDTLAPEHLELAVADPDPLAARVRHAGAVFLGRHTPEAIGDYVAGPNHVLPTSRSARFSSGLGVLDFMKRTSLVGCAPEGLAAIGPAAETLAVAEGLHAHALSIAVRLRSDRGE